MDQIRKFIEFEVKEVEGEDRTLSAVASTGVKDRDGDIIEPSGWKLRNFRKNPVIMWVHEYRGTGALPIGNAPEVKIEDDKLKFKVKFVEKEIYPFAETVFQMYKKRYLRTFSVGFIPLKSEELDDDDKDKKGMFSSRRYTSQELLEISGCPVPSNVEAMAETGMKDVMAKSFGLSEPEKEITPGFDFESRLPHHDKDGSVNKNKLRACIALVMGARGGIDLEDETRDEVFSHLNSHSEKAYILFSKSKDETIKTYKDEEEALREMFDDVWFEELGDVMTLEMEYQGKESEIKSGRVLSEKNRSLVKKCIDALNEVYSASEPKDDEEGKEVFNCECIKCGHKMKSKKHCNDIKCPKCGGQMRRAERPGPGREISEEDNKTLDSISNDLAEIEKKIKS